MSDLVRLLGGDPDDPREKLASLLVREDHDLLDELRQIRRRSGLTQREVADRLGVVQETVSAFERLGNDPRLSSIRRYALAVGALVTHNVRPYQLDREAQRAARQLNPEHQQPSASAIHVESARKAAAFVRGSQQAKKGLRRRNARAASAVGEWAPR